MIRLCMFQSTELQHFYIPTATHHGEIPCCRPVSDVFVDHLLYRFHKLKGHLMSHFTEEVSQLKHQKQVFIKVTAWLHIHIRQHSIGCCSVFNFYVKKCNNTKTVLLTHMHAHTPVHSRTHTHPHRHRRGASFINIC